MQLTTAFLLDKRDGADLTKLRMSTIRQETSVRIWAVGLWAVAFLTLMGDVGHAAGTETKCAAAKQKAAGRYAGGKLGCYAKATKGGVPVDPACLQKAVDKFDGTFAKVEAAGGCVIPGYPAILETMVDTLVTDVVNATPSGAFSGCAAGKQKTAGKSAASQLGCYAKATKGGVPVDPACLQKAAGKFAGKFAKEEEKTSGGCATFGIAASIGARVDTFVANVMRATPVAVPPARCCANAGSAFCADLSVANESQCMGGYAGTLAGPGLVCDGTSGTWKRVRRPPPAAATPLPALRVPGYVSRAPARKPSAAFSAGPSTSPRNVCPRARAQWPMSPVRPARGQWDTGNSPASTPVAPPRATQAAGRCRWRSGTRSIPPTPSDRSRPTC
jgi:hypothetical protein